MALVPRDYFTDFDRMFEEFFPVRRRRGDTLPNFFSPHVDIEEQGDHYLVKAELPGVKKEDVKVTLENGMLTLQAEHREEKEEKKKGKVIRSERRVGKFSRSFSVPTSVKADDISASMEEGVLTIKIPKTKEERAAKSKQISIG